MVHASAKTLAWPSLVQEAQRPELLAILDELAEALRPEPREALPGLSGGVAGSALFLGYCAKLPGREGLAADAETHLGDAVARVGEAYGSDFYSGYTGIAWGVEHLQREVLGGEGEDGDPNEGVDEVLLDLLSESPWRSHYDLISGLVGYGVYGLERVDRPGGRAILGRVLDHLEALARPQPVGLTWPTPPELLPPWQRETAPEGYLNLGLAHGVPGVLILLAALSRAGARHPELGAERAAALLEGGMAWLFSQLQDPACGSFLGGWLAVGAREPASEGSRVAWCYGDLGASLALLQAARLAGREDWEARALAMARLAAGRPLAASGVMDVGLCHGSAGNMVAFLRLHQLTGEALFLEAARRYLDHLLQVRIPGAPLGGFTAFRPDRRPDGTFEMGARAYLSNPGLLEGSAGVGLALLAALGVEPRWDRFMLLSLPELP